MAVACLASIAIFAGAMATLYGLDWYKNRRSENRALAKKRVVDNTTTKEEQPIAEQLA